MAEEKDTKEWTLMFYFASDNPLAPGIISQLKALKNAGYHHEVNVVAYFDPQAAGTPSHFFDVNSFNKLTNSEPRIGFGNDPFVRNLMEDKLWEDGDLNRDGKSIKELLEKKVLERIEKEQDRSESIREQLTIRARNNPRPVPPRPEKLIPPPPDNHAGAAPGGNPGPGPEIAAQPPAEGHAGARHHDNSDPVDSLWTFLKFCAEQYKAKHYMLFILGHGLVVGDDVFLFDEHADKHSVTLIELRRALEKFKGKLSVGKFELVSFHSCSMSGLEVAFELQGTANYMLASQGPAFVGSWPYTQILIRVFNDVKDMIEKGIEIDVENMLKRISGYVYHNSKDFMLAGYSFDVTLCDLNKIPVLGGPIKKLAEELIQGLKEGMVKNCILLAHLQSQSYWEENYTDLYDFCFCLERYCDQFQQAAKDPGPYAEIRKKCDRVMDILMKQSAENPVIFGEFAGPNSQYSHGFSFFFPWTRPASDKAVIEEYEGYKYNQVTGWFDFLKKYWGPEDFDGDVAGSTMRASYSEEKDKRAILPNLSEEDELDEDMISKMFDASGPLSKDSVLANTSKPNPRDPTGDECDCGSIKNYRHDTRSRRERDEGKKPPTNVPVSQTQIEP